MAAGKLRKLSGKSKVPNLIKAFKADRGVGSKHGAMGEWLSEADLEYRKQILITRASSEFDFVKSSKFSI